MNRSPYLGMRTLAGLMLLSAVPGTALHAQTFLTAPINLSGTGQAVIPAIAAGPGGDIDVAWLDSSAIRFRRSTDGGKTFSATMTVATMNLPLPASQPQIAVNSAGVYVAWAGTNSSGGGDIFFASLASGASSFSAPANVSGGKGIASGSSAPVPHMAVDPSGGVDIVWGQSAAYFARTTDGGKSFVTTTPPLSTSRMASVSPRIGVNAQGTYVIWENADPNYPTSDCPTITFARSTDNGASFTEYPVDDTLTVNQGTETGCTHDVQIALGANNTIHLLWANDHSNVSSIRDLIVTYQTDSGSSFAGFDKNNHLGFQNLASTAAYTPQMAIDNSGNIDVVWMGDYQQNGTPQAVYFSRSMNTPTSPAGSQGNFSTPQPLTTPPTSGAGAGFPQIAAEQSGAIDILWQQASAANPSGAYDIVLARSTDGSHFTKSMLDNSPTTQASTGQVAVDASGNVYAVWQGSSGSGGDILLNGDSAGLATSGTFSLNGVKATVSPVSAVINVGGAGSFTLSLTSTNSAPGNVTFGCGGALAGVSCSFSPGSLTLNPNASASTSLNVSVSIKPSASAAERNPGELGPWPGSLPVIPAWALAAALVVALIAAQRARHGRRLARVLALASLLAAAAAGMMSCGGSTQGGGGGGGGSITFPLTVQGQSNSTSASLQTISITVP
jgi:hypothetical protein